MTRPMPAGHVHQGHLVGPQEGPQRTTTEWVDTLPILQVPNLPGALCAQADPDAFFPEKGGSVAVPRTICARCPVRKRCAQWAITHRERFGVWGGTTPQEREAIWAAQPPVQVPDEGRKLPWPHPCAQCGRLMRPNHASQSDWPGTVSSAGNICGTCWRRSKAARSAANQNNRLPRPQARQDTRSGQPSQTIQERHECPQEP